MKPHIVLAATLSLAAIGCQAGLRVGGAPSVAARPAPSTPPPATGTASDEFSCPAEAGGDLSHILDEAAPLPLDGLMEGCSGEGDRNGDAFALLAPSYPAGTLYTLDFKTRASDGDVPNLRVQLYDDDRRKENIDLAGDGAVWFTVPPNRRAYVVVKGFYSSSTIKYAFTATASALPDDTEPNSSFEQAMPLALDTPANGLLMNQLATQDVDYYAIDVPRAGTLSLVISNVPQSVMIRGNVFDGDRAELVELWGANEGATERVSLSVKPGRYYVMVKGDKLDEERPYGQGAPPSRVSKKYQVTATLE